MHKHKIRALAIGVFWRGREILVGEGYDPVKQQIFYRPLGGAIEFGELGVEALRREMLEETEAAIKDECLLGTLENLFVFNGEPGHEIVQVYQAAFVAPAMYARDEVIVREGENTGRALWKPLRFFEEGRAPLYPDGLLELIAKKRA